MNRTLYHKNMLGTTFGAYKWQRPGKGGIVLRLGPVGHLQLMTYRFVVLGSGTKKEGRRGKHGVALHFWGVRGRRRKRGIDVGVIL